MLGRGVIIFFCLWPWPFKLFPRLFQWCFFFFILDEYDLSGVPPSLCMCFRNPLKWTWQLLISSTSVCRRCVNTLNSVKPLLLQCLVSDPSGTQAPSSVEPTVRQFSRMQWCINRTNVWDTAKPTSRYLLLNQSKPLSLFVTSLRQKQHMTTQTYVTDIPKCPCCISIHPKDFPHFP